MTEPQGGPAAGSGEGAPGAANRQARGKGRWRLAWLLGTALALRLGACWSQWGSPLIGDAQDYAAIATHLWEGGEFSLKPGTPTARRPPLYPWFLAPFAALGPGSWDDARLAQAVLDSTTCLFLVGFALRAFRRTQEQAVVLAGAWLYAVHPVFIAYSGRLLTEALFFWAWGLGLWLLLACADGAERENSGESLRWWREAASAAPAGLALGAAILCRPTAIAFPVFGAAALALAKRLEPRVLVRVGAAAAFAYLTILPWAARNKGVMGQWLPVATGGGMSFWVGTQVGHYPNWQGKGIELSVGRTDVEVDREFYRIAKEEYRRSWPRIILDIPRRAGHFWLTSHSSLFGVDRPTSEYRREGRWGALALRAALWGLHLALLAAGAWGVWMTRRESPAGAALAAAVFLYYTLHVVTDYGPNRYHLPALMIWLPFAGRALLSLSPGDKARSGA